MSVYEVGQTLVWRFTVTDESGVAANFGTSAAATVTLPDGTTAAGTIANTVTGQYDVTYATSTQHGRYRVRLVGTGTNSGGSPYSDVADVWPADPRLIISLDDAREGLNLTSTQTVHNNQLRAHVVAATTIVEHIAGRILTASEVDTVSGGGRYSLPLDHLPRSVTTVVEDSVTLTAGTDYCWDECGLLWRGSQPRAATWSDTAPRNVVVTYVVGRGGVVDDVIRIAGKRLVAHLYGQELSPGRPAPGGTPGGTTMIAGYAVPNMVVELLRTLPAPTRMPGLA